ncbi:(d)CMP kinase, partial [Siminovitchia fortis]|uniref:(d)CMP kinase n=1 Tax=Siminovitchia fortis TaxID=254758 RepID=UPI0036F1B04B
MVSPHHHLTKKARVVMHPRDIRTKLFPNPHLKIFLLPTLHIPPHPPHKHNLQKRFPSNLPQFKQHIILPHKKHSQPQLSPLTKPDHPLQIHTSS